MLPLLCAHATSHNLKVLRKRAEQRKKNDVTAYMTHITTFLFSLPRQVMVLIREEMSTDFYMVRPHLHQNFNVSNAKLSSFVTHQHDFLYIA